MIKIQIKKKDIDNKKVLRNNKNEEENATLN